MKVRANELRIGNLVILNNPKYHPESTGKIFMIDSVKNDDVSLFDYENLPSIILYQYLKYIEPIPLTEEWLLKLRSRESLPVNYKNIYIMLDRFLLTYQASYGFWYVYDFSGEEMLYITKVEFVHEWQNVYFALNGEELTLTEHPTPAS